MKKNKKLKCFLENKNVIFPLKKQYKIFLRNKRKKYYRWHLHAVFQKILQGNVKIVIGSK